MNRLLMYIIIVVVPVYSSLASAQHSVLVNLSGVDKARLVLPQDLVYEGAFRFPSGGENSRWSYGASGFTFYPNGDSTGPNDGYPGSLYGIGHDHHQLVAEISIPKPVTSLGKNAAELNVATFLQDFADITGGLRSQIGVDKVGGLSYLPKMGAQATGKIYWTIYEYYNANGVDYLSHGWSELNLSKVQAKGVWHVGPKNNSEFHSMRSADYIFEIPASWADIHVGNKYLASGRHREAGAFGSSEGPALFAFGPYNDGNPPGNGAVLDAVPLIWYPKGGGYYPDYSECDRWGGGAWLTAGEKSAVVFVGSKALGDTYYGDGRSFDCSNAKGYHCTPYEPQIIFYDPEDLTSVANGGKKPYQVVPYAIFRPAGFMWDQCRVDLGGAAFDRARGLLYVFQKSAERVTNSYESYPLAHVFKITGSGSPVDTTPPSPPTKLELQP
ncbi:MAG: hypothetical protein D8M57_03805 [Candidatus Scalindua sp. AMX11]|nr:hypothetical protein [Planctomycetota bacterium]RZV95283.1 MAG: hypothetical protein EX341_02830 [Candidatus Scalindua sp. SCAELEC01]TDE66237.1 MAG: hypothetical protein D8M57_03805 [Candidatus Scalindua sp. AMX11]GJQ57857.1 MAG: hypothetical protein SCALA701_06580 [Candidatus Scalindua sp.]